MKRVAFFHNALGKTDGVSLEVDKWKAVLEEMGHEVHYCAGNDDAANVYCIPELSFFEPLTNKILTNGTVRFSDYSSEKELEDDIYKQAEIIQRKVLEFIDLYNIDVLIPNNLQSVGYNIPAVIALSRVIEETGLPAICHNHDFYFENSGEVSPTCDTVKDIFEKHIPPAHSNAVNLVINRLAQEQLKNRKNLKSFVVPNVFDFNQTMWNADEYNLDFRKAIGVGQNDIMFLQATRVLDRKGIELAIDIVAEMNKEHNREKLYRTALYDGRSFAPGDKICLVCSGYVEKFGISGDYHGNLLKRAQRKGVEIKFVGDIVKHTRSTEDGRKTYSLWDSYVHADFVTYPSLWEGWGNQLIEAIFAKLPVVIYEYPVFKSDLKQSEFELVSLGSQIDGKDELGLVKVAGDKLDKAAQEIIWLLTQKEERERVTAKNFNIAKHNYSYEILEQIIRSVFKKLGI